MIIFTDLDGTLLDADYSFTKAEEALDLIREKGIPLILCSSKTRAEIEVHRERLDNDHPFIAENGGGIFMPIEAFKSKVDSEKFNVEEEKDYLIIKLGANYSDLRNVINELRSEGFAVRGFGDMDVDEVSELTGLSTEESRLAKRREFDEPFLFNGDEQELERIKKRIRDKGFNFTQSKFFHIMGKSDKGRAVEILKGLYERDNGILTTIALGDAFNDLEMLQKVDYPVIVKRPDGSYEERINMDRLIKADGIGPEGWNKAIIKLINHKFQAPKNKQITNSNYKT
jgi:mannosyl-3-phosphoglycerate phosphatase